MKLIHTLTLRSLLKNRSRTVVTIIGIILSAAMITGVTTLVSSTRRFAADSVRLMEGDWHGVYYSAEESALQTLKNSREAERDGVFSAQILGYAKPEGIRNEGKPYLHLLGADEVFFRDMSVRLTEGRLPENSAELLIPDHLAENGGLRLSVGDVLTLAVCERRDEGGSLLLQSSSLQAEYSESDGSIVRLHEQLVQTETRQYTVVGFYARPAWEPYSAPGYTALTVQDDAPAEGSRYNVYFRLSRPRNTFSFLSGQQGFRYVSSEANAELLMFYGISSYSGFMSALAGFAAILILLIMVGSVSLIYNAFSISVSQRTRQFGLLSSIGMTRKQLRAVVRREALYVSAVGIPLGILGGILGIWVTLLCIGDRFAGLFSGTSVGSMRLFVSPAAVILAAVIALVTVLISARVPARRAMRMTAIEAIRQTQDVTVSAKRVRTSRLTQRLFGLEGTLAKKNFKRSRKSYRSTVVSLVMSIVLFISTGSFCAYLRLSVGGVFGEGSYALWYSVPSGGAEYTDAESLSSEETMPAAEVAALLSGTEGVTSLNRLTSWAVDYEADASALSKDVKALLDVQEPGTQTLSATILVTDDAVYRSFLAENGLSEREYMNADAPKFPAVQHVSALIGGKYRNFEMFRGGVPEETEFFCMTDEGEKRFTLHIGTPVEALVMGADRFTESGLCVLLPESLANEATDGFCDPAHTNWNLYMTAEDHAQAYKAAERALRAAQLPTWRLFDERESEQTTSDIVTIINVFSYGFIVLISLIALANAFNTISTNVMLRRREFAMLRSIGETRRGLSRMMNYECLLYGAKSLLFGLPVSAVLTYLIFLSADSGYQMHFFMPLPPVLIAVGSVFLVVFIAMRYAARQIRESNPIEALRSENA